MDLNRLLGNIEDIDFEHYQFLRQHLFEGVTVSKDILKESIEIDSGTLTGLAMELINSQYISSHIFRRITSEDFNKNHGLGKVGEFFSPFDVVELTLGSEKVGVKLLQASDAIIQNEQTNGPIPIQQYLIKKAIEILEEDIKGLEKSVNNPHENRRISPFLNDLYIKQGRLVAPGFARIDNSTSILNQTQREILLEGSKTIHQLLKSKTPELVRNVQFLQHVFVEEYPLSKENIRMYYTNCFKRNCHFLGIDYRKF